MERLIYLALCLFEMSFKKPGKLGNSYSAWVDICSFLHLHEQNPSIKNVPIVIEMLTNLNLPKQNLMSTIER